VLAQLDINDASVIAPLMYALRTRYAIRDQVNAAVKRLYSQIVIVVRYVSGSQP
jgi:hypothetical protein